MAAALPFIALGASVLGTGVSAVGAIQQGQQAAAAAEYSAQVQEQNARIAREQGATEAARIARGVERQIGTIGANTGASGLTMEGSPLAVLLETRKLGRLDELTAGYNAEVQARGAQAQAQQYRLAGRDAASAGYIGAASALLTGATSAYGIVRQAPAGSSLSLG